MPEKEKDNIRGCVRNEKRQEGERRIRGESRPVPKRHRT
jgi:hypothetical protein